MLPLEEFAGRVCSLMPRILSRMIRQERNYLSRGLITLPQLHVLQHVGSASAPCAMRAICSALGMKASTLTGIVDRLHQLGLVSRSRGTRDRRAVLVVVTAKGKEILKQLRDDRFRSVMRVFGELTDAERRAYIDILQKLAAGMDLPGGSGIRGEGRKGT